MPYTVVLIGGGGGHCNANNISAPGKQRECSGRTQEERKRSTHTGYTFFHAQIADKDGTI